MRQGRVGQLVVGVALSLAACSFPEPSVPAGREIACSEGDLCPTGQTCAPLLHRCVADADLLGPPLSLLSPTLSPALGNRTTRFEVTVVASREPAGLLRVTGLAARGGVVARWPFTCEPCDADRLCRCSTTFDQEPIPPEGPMAVEIEGEDRGGRRGGPLTAGTLLLDFTAPALAAPATLELTAPAGAPRGVTALGPGGSARLCFRTTEPLATTPTFEVEGGEGLQLTLDGAVSTAERFCVVADRSSSAADGARVPFARLVDAAGNAARVPLLPSDAPLRLDGTPPQPPELSPDRGLLHRRAPWGVPGAIGVPQQSVISRGEAFGEAGVLRLFADRERTALLAEAAVTAGALTQPIAILGPDRSELWAELWDAAGNVQGGGPVRIREGEWTATLGNKELGETQLNPHECSAQPVHGGRLLQADDEARELDARTGPTATATAISGAATWRERSASFGPALQEPVAAHDPASGTTFLFGYRQDDQLRSTRELWAWDGRDWRRVDDGSREGPSVRLDPSLTFDRARGRLVLFGGADLLGFYASLCDTWEWTGVRWIRMADCQAGGRTDPDQPPPREKGALAFDPVSGLSVLIGGNDDSVNLTSDAWAWNGRTWRVLRKPGAGRTAANLVFRPGGSGGSLFLHGGDLDDGFGFDEPANETWEGRWNPGRADYDWQKLAGGTLCRFGEPACFRGLTAIAPDGTPWRIERDDSSSSLPLFNVWFWNGNSWESPESTVASHIDAFIARGDDPARPFLVVGSLGTSPEGTTWDCSFGDDGSCRKRHRPGTLPLDRTDGSLAFDPAGHGLLMGGLPPGLSTGDLTEAAFWDGDDWRPLTTASAGPGPSARSVPALGWNAAAGRFWLFGGRHNEGSATVNPADAWAFDPGAGRWSPLAPTGLPGSSTSHLSVVESGSGVLLAGGAGEGLLKADATPAFTAAGPAPTGEGHVVLDPASGRYLQSSRTAPVLTSWAPGESAWQPIAGVPHGVEGPVIADGAARKVLFLLDLIAASGRPGAVLQLQGGQAVPLPIADPEGDGEPQVRIDPTAGYDPMRGTTLLFAGATLDRDLRDTWELSLAHERPALVCRWRLAAARLPASAELRSARLHAQAGGSGGIEASNWLEGRWQRWGGCSASDGGCPDGGTTLDLGGIPPEQVARSGWDRGAFGTRLTPGEENGAGLSRLSASELAFTLGYRLAP